MFEIKPETKETAVNEMKEILSKSGVCSTHLTDEAVGEAFDAAVAIVKKQFGM
jgi:hypothetical protein